MKKKITYLFISFTLFAITLNAQTAAKREIFSKEFNWTITLPEGFEAMSQEEQERIEKKGKDALESTTGMPIENHVKSIFVFKKDQAHYFEANYQPFDTAIDGNYDESCKAVYDILFETFQTQMAGAKIERFNATEKIDGLEFHTFTVKVQLPNNMVMTMMMFNRLYDKKDLSVNIIYIDQTKGMEMLNSLRQSKFKK